MKPTLTLVDQFYIKRTKQLEALDLQILRLQKQRELLSKSIPQKFIKHEPA